MILSQIATVPQLSRAVEEICLKHGPQNKKFESHNRLNVLNNIRRILGPRKATFPSFFQHFICSIFSTGFMYLLPLDIRKNMAKVWKNMRNIWKPIWLQTPQAEKLQAFGLHICSAFSGWLVFIFVLHFPGWDSYG